jgi:ABC-type multidrug transport system fused ATPase/permease subunit
MEKELQDLEPKVESNNKVTALERTLEVHLAEYETLRKEIENTFDMRRQIVSFSTLTAGGVIPLTVGFIEGKISTEAFLYLLLFIPIVFAGATLAYAGQNRAVIMAAGYIDTRLRPQIKRVLTELGNLTDASEGILEWEYFTRTTQQPSLLDKFLRGLTGIGDFIILFSPIVGGVLGFLYLRSVMSVRFTPILIALLSIDIFLAVIVLVSAAKVGMGYYESKYLRTEER